MTRSEALNALVRAWEKEASGGDRSQSGHYDSRTTSGRRCAIVARCLGELRAALALPPDAGPGVVCTIHLPPGETKIEGTVPSTVRLVGSPAPAAAPGTACPKCGEPMSKHEEGNRLLDGSTYTRCPGTDLGVCLACYGNKRLVADEFGNTIVCPACHGTGRRGAAAPGTEPRWCYVCGGTKKCDCHTVCHGCGGTGRRGADGGGGT